jgi:hypothetical protein
MHLRNPRAVMRFARLRRGSASGIIQRCGARGLRRSLCDLASARNPAARCRSHHYGCGRAIRTADRLNGLPLTKIHHAAFDAHLIGIDPDFCVDVSERLLEIHDGPFLGLGLKGIVGQVIQLPRRSEDHPDRDRLARRSEEFKKAA